MSIKIINKNIRCVWISAWEDGLCEKRNFILKHLVVINFAKRRKIHKLLPALHGTFIYFKILHELVHNFLLIACSLAMFIS